MNLLFIKYSINVEFKENIINVLTIENQNALTDILQDIWLQCNGMNGESVLSEKEKELKLSKEADIIFNIFSVDCNDKKIIGKIYQELALNSNEMLLGKISAINSEVVKFIDDVLQTVPYRLSQNMEMDLCGLLKLYDVKIDCVDSSLTENLINYIKLAHQVLKKSIFIFVNLKQYLNESELMSLYEASFYEKIFILIIEGNDSKHIENETHQILDKDLCLIKC